MILKKKIPFFPVISARYPPGITRNKQEAFRKTKHSTETRQNTHTHMVWSYPGAQLGSVFAMFPHMTSGCLFKVLSSVLIVPSKRSEIE
jgi:hypothetical protein